MDRTERLLSLIASLLDAPEPVPVTTIRGWFPDDYGAVSDDAFERKFERDKADLVALGIPLQFAHGDDGADDGYLVDRSEVYLPELDFDADELAILYIAGSGLLSQREFPYHRDLARALDKIALRVAPDADARARVAARRVLLNHPVQQKTDDLSDRLELVSQAIADRRRLRLVYHTLYSGQITERTVDPYGMRCWKGRWGMVGYCHQRDDIRVFSLHRIQELELEPGDVPAFEPPADFSIAAWQMQPPWRYQLHPPVTVRVDVDPERAWYAADQLGVPAGDANGDRVTFQLEVTNRDGFLEWVLNQGPHVRVLAPDDLRDRVIATLRQVIDLHQEPAA